MNSMVDGRMKPTSISAGFVVTVLYLFFEYGRPQDHITVLRSLRPGLVLMALLVVLLFNQRYRLHMVASPQTSRMLALLALFALHVPFALNNGRAYIATEAFLMYVVVFVSLIVFVDTLDRLRLLMKCWILLMCYIAVNGIIGGGDAGSSFLQDENDFALLMNMMLPFSVFLFFYERKVMLRLFYLVASLLCVASIVASFSRGGFVGLALVAIAVWLTSTRKIVLLGVAVALILIILNLRITHVGTTVAGSTYWEEMTTITDDGAQDYNKDSRVELWKSGWEMFMDHPLGVGPQNFSVVLPEYQTAYFGEKSMWGKAAHSIWFTLLPELGIPGVWLYFSLILANVRDLRCLRGLLSGGEDIHRFAYFLSLAFITSLVGFFASGTFLSVLYYPHYWYVVAMIVVTRKVVQRHAYPRAESALFRR